MTLALKLLCRVAQHRISGGEKLEDILKDYSRLNEEEQKELLFALDRVK